MTPKRKRHADGSNQKFLDRSFTESADQKEWLFSEKDFLLPLKFSSCESFLCEGFSKGSVLRWTADLNGTLWPDDSHGDYLQILHGPGKVVIRAGHATSHESTFKSLSEWLTNVSLEERSHMNEESMIRVSLPEELCQSISLGISALDESDFVVGPPDQRRYRPVSNGFGDLIFEPFARFVTDITGFIVECRPRLEIRYLEGGGLSYELLSEENTTNWKLSHQCLVYVNLWTGCFKKSSTVHFLDSSDGQELLSFTSVSESGIGGEMLVVYLGGDPLVNIYTELTEKVTSPHYQLCMHFALRP